METKLTQKILKELQESLSNNQEVKVIDELKKLSPKDYDDELTILKSTIKELNENKRKGILNEDNFRKEKNKILNSLLEILKEIEERRKLFSEDKFNINLINNEEELKNILEEKLNFRYEILGNIYSGDRSIIFKVLDKHSHDEEKIIKAIKVIKPFSILKEENLGELHFDIKNLEKISSHDGIISMYDKKLKTYPWYFIMQYIKGNTIREYLKLGWRWRIDEVLRILLKIINTVNICHQHDIIHGNLRLNKIILNREEENNPVISPFRVLKNSFYSKRTYEKILHNCMYMSPEELSEGINSMESDQFSIGLIAYEMIEGKPLYEGKDSLEVINRRIIHKNDPEFIRNNIRNKKCPNELIEVIDKMLKYETKDRFGSLRNAADLIIKILGQESFKIEEEALIVQSSYDRCRKNQKFFEYFYDNFFKTNKGAKEKFKNVEKQYEKLDMAIDRLVGIAKLEESEIQYTIKNLSKRHSTEWGIKEMEFDIFVIQLMDAIKKFDSKNWNVFLENAWTKILEEGVRLMKNYSKVK